MNSETTSGSQQSINQSDNSKQDQKSFNQHGAAYHFLESVKTVYRNDSAVYRQFLDIMKSFKNHSIDANGVITSVKVLFKDHPDLFAQFYSFLPIEQRQQQQQLRQQKRSTVNKKLNQRQQSMSTYSGEGGVDVGTNIAVNNNNVNVVQQQQQDMKKSLTNFLPSAQMPKLMLSPDMTTTSFQEGMVSGFQGQFSNSNSSFGAKYHPGMGMPQLQGGGQLTATGGNQLQNFNNQHQQLYFNNQPFLNGPQVVGSAGTTMGAINYQQQQQQISQSSNHQANVVDSIMNDSMGNQNTNSGNGGGGTIFLNQGNMPPIVPNSQVGLNLASIPGMVQLFQTNQGITFLPLNTANLHPSSPSFVSANAQKSMQQESSSNKVGEEYARKYVQKIRMRFEDQPGKYRKFLDILHNFHEEKNTIDEVTEQVESLLMDHKDLLDEFYEFLPESFNSQQQKRQQNWSRDIGDTCNKINMNSVINPENFIYNDGDFRYIQQQQGQQSKDMMYQNRGQMEYYGSYMVVDGSVMQQRQKQQMMGVVSNVMSETVNGSGGGGGGGGDENLMDMVYSSYGRAKEKMGKGGRSYCSFSELDRFFRLSQHFMGQKYDEFLKILFFYNMEILSAYEVYCITRDLFNEDAPVFMIWFKKMLNLGNLKDGTFDGGVYGGSCGGNMKYSLEYDWNNAKKLGSSYREIPTLWPSLRCSGRLNDPICSKVLNDSWVSVSCGSEFKFTRKNHYDELLFKCEDDRLELDLMIGTNMNAIRTLERIMIDIECNYSKDLDLGKRIAENKTEEFIERFSRFESNGMYERKKKMHENENENERRERCRIEEINPFSYYRVDISKIKNIGSIQLKKSDFDIIVTRSIKRLYDDKSEEMFEHLLKKPFATIPIIIERLKQKDVEWNNARREWNIIWCKVQKKAYRRSLDYLSTKYKVDEKNQLNYKNLLLEVKKVNRDKNVSDDDDDDDEDDDGDDGNGNGNGNGGYPTLTYYMKSDRIFFDIYTMLGIVMDRLVTVDRRRFEWFWSDLIERFFHLDYGEWPKNNGGDELGMSCEDGNYESIIRKIVNVKEKFEESDNDNQSQDELVDEDNISNKPIHIDFSVRESGNTALFLGNKTFYLMFRYLQILFERLKFAFEISVNKPLKNPKECNQDEDDFFYCYYDQLIDDRKDIVGNPMEDSSKTSKRHHRNNCPINANSLLSSSSMPPSYENLDYYSDIINNNSLYMRKKKHYSDIKSDYEKKIERIKASDDERFIYPTYLFFVDLLKAFLGNKISSTVYEDECFEELGINSYPLFTIDKILILLAKQIQTVISDITCNHLIYLFQYETTRPSGISDTIYLANFKKLVSHDKKVFVFTYNLDTDKKKDNLFNLCISRIDYDQCHENPSSPSSSHHEILSKYTNNFVYSNKFSFTNNETYSNSADCINGNVNTRSSHTGIIKSGEKTHRFSIPYLKKNLTNVFNEEKVIENSMGIKVMDDFGLEFVRESEDYLCSLSRDRGFRIVDKKINLAQFRTISTPDSPSNSGEFPLFKDTFTPLSPPPTTVAHS